MSTPTQRTFEYKLPLPILGRNTQDALDRMDERYCLEFENLIVSDGAIVPRKGCVQHSTGVGSFAVQSIHGHTASSGAHTILTTANGNIYNSTSSGTASGLASGLNEDIWYSAQFNGRLFLVSGNDAPRDWNGSTLSSTSWTGPSSINALISVSTFKDRVYFVEKDTGSIWYGGVAAITGALTEYPVSPYLSQGGTVLFTTQWSRATGDGEENQFIVVGTEGDCLVYGGDYPGGTWSLQRRMTIPKPLGRRAHVRLGADVIIATESGIISLTEWLQGVSNAGKIRITEKVNKEFKNLVQQYRSNEGWTVERHETERWLIINIPRVEGNSTSNGDSCQFIFDTETSAISKFTNWKANCFLSLDNELYFGGNSGVVYKANSGLDDHGVNISFKLRTAYSYFNQSLMKILKLLRVSIRANETILADITYSTDYKNSNDKYEFYREIDGTSWGEPWYSAWTEGEQDVTEYAVARGHGKTFSIGLEGSVSSGGFRLQGFDVIGELGGVH